MISLDKTSSSIVELTPHELDLLEELEGLRDPSPWGSWIGACLEFFQESGYATRNGKISEKGKNALYANRPGLRRNLHG